VARFSLKRSWHRRPGPWHVATMVSEADQIPDVLNQHEATLVRPGRVPKWLAFDCPCNRGHRILLNLDRSRWPSWTVASEAPLSVWPSIDVEIDARRCHYLVLRGHVDWVRCRPDALRATDAGYYRTGRIR
jgi:hypothetical protein